MSVAGNTHHFSPLFRRFEGLGRKDQRAILERLSEDERAALEVAIAADKQARAEEEKRMQASDRQYLGYSAWLAELVEASVTGIDTSLTQSTRIALAAEHRANLDLADAQVSTGWRGLLAKLQDLLSLPQALPR